MVKTESVYVAESFAEKILICEQTLFDCIYRKSFSIGKPYSVVTIVNRGQIFPFAVRTTTRRACLMHHLKLVDTTNIFTYNIIIFNDRTF